MGEITQLEVVCDVAAMAGRREIDKETASERSQSRYVHSVEFP